MRMERLIFEEDNQGAVMSAVVTVEELKKFRVVHSDSHQQDHPTCAWLEGTDQEITYISIHAIQEGLQ